MDNKPMRLLLIEDDEFDCSEFKRYAYEIDNVELVGITNSSSEGLELVKDYSPEGVILDIELHKGQGSGLDFLENLRDHITNLKPLIVVTTNSASSVLYDKLNKSGVDLIFYKHQTNYCPKTVILELLALRKSLYQYNAADLEGQALLRETQAEFRYKMSTRINTELDLIGVSSHLKGREYIHDAILFLIESSPEELDRITPFNYLSSKYYKTSSSISRVMQTAINYAWRTSAPDELERYYTAKVNYQTGVPTPTELMYYYSRKIKNSL